MEIATAESSVTLFDPRPLPVQILYGETRTTRFIVCLCVCECIYNRHIQPTCMACIQMAFLVVGE